MASANGARYAPLTFLIPLMRTFLAVVLGYLVFAVSAVALFQLTHQAPHATTTIGFAALATVYGIAFAAISGWIAYRLARRDDLVAPICLAIVVALGATVSLISTWRQPAHWSQWTAIFLMAPATIAGGMTERILSRRNS